MSADVAARAYTGRVLPWARMASRAASETEVDDVVRRVAERLRTLRSARGLTLEQLGNLCGVSRATLSQIETRGTNPTLAVLWKIAAGLGVPFSALMDDGPEEEPIRLVNTAEQDVIRSADGSLESRPVAVGKSLGGVEIYELTLAPGCVHKASAHASGVTEAVVVLAGRVRVRVGEAMRDARTGQSLIFAADKPHVYDNPGSREARVLNVIVYPT